MNDLKSISQLANDLQVTRQTIYNKLKDKALSASVEPYIVKQGNFTFYTVKAQELIKQAVLGGDVKEDFTECQREFDNVSKELTACKNELDSVSKDFTKCQNDLTECKKELDIKDKIINELNAKNANLQAIEQTVKDLQSQLKDKSKEIEELEYHLVGTKNALEAANLNTNRNQILLNTQKNTYESKLANNANIIKELKAQIDDLKKDKTFLQSQLTAKDNQLSEQDNTIKALTAEREQERKERQTILAELLQLRGQKAINVKAEPRPKGAATKQEPKQKKKLSLRDKLRAAADIFKR